MKKLFLALCALVVISGCQVFKSIGEYANENPIAVQIVTRQAVFRYIDAGDTQAAKDSRAASVMDVVQRADAFLEGNPVASVDTLLQVVDSAINWEGLSAADRLLVQDVMTLVALSLEQRQSEGLLDEDAVIGLRAILRTSVEAAELL